jgi:hypothetical protein
MYLMMGLRKMSDQSKKKEEDEFFEEEVHDREEPQNERNEYEEERLRKRREWLRSLTQVDRDFIARYGEDAWRAWNNRGWKNHDIL